MKSVLILEDDDSLSKSLARELTDLGYVPTRITSAKQIPKEAFQFAIVDLRLNAGEMGLDAIQKILEASRDCKVIVLSGYGSIATAVEAVKRGATDYLTKPASIQQIDAALQGHRLQAESELTVPSLSQVEHEYIDFVLTKNQGNISKTAKDLGLHRQSLQRKLKKYT